MSTCTAIHPLHSRIQLAARRTAAPIAAMALYSLTSAVVVFAEVARTGHHLIYALDDTYIEMAMGRSLAFHGIWGITRYAFSPASSSPLYTLLLALVFRWFGLHTWIPLALSLFFGAVAIYQAARLTERYLRPSAVAALLAALVLLTPLFAIGTLGMEHTLLLALSLAFLNLFGGRTRPFVLMVIAALLVGTRYEGLCLTLAAAGLSAFRSDLRRCAAIVAGALLPVCAYAIFARLHGSPLVPNSIALKALQPNMSDAVGQVAVNLVMGAHLALLAGALSVGIAQLRRHSLFPLLLLILVADLGHLAAGRFGWGYRYEDYAVALSILGSGLIAAHARKFPRGARIAFASLAGLGCMLCAARATLAATMYPRYSHAVYLQQVQVGRFLGDTSPAAALRPMISVRSALKLISGVSISLVSPIQKFSERSGPGAIPPNFWQVGQSPRRYK